jgi:hypothetical protein
MNKAILTLAIILVCVVSISGKVKKTDFAAQDTLRFKLFPSVSHNIQISASNIENIIYFVDDISINKADWLDKGMCTFLNADMNLTDITIDGTEISFKEYSNVKAESFEPILRLQAYKDMKGKCRLYEMLFEDVTSLPDTFSVKMKYLINVADTLNSLKIVDGKVVFLGNTLWYPRNLNQNENLRLAVKTMDKVTVSLNKTDLPYKQSGFMRSSEVKFVDFMDNPVDITFRK